MSTHKQIDRICVAVIAISLLLTILFMNGSSFGIETMVDEDAESYTGSVYFTENDQNGAWDVTDAVNITLEGTDGAISGSGAYFYDGDLVIASGGTYVVSGKLTDGSIIVDVYEASKVWILLDGVKITCSDDACIRVNEADKVFLTLAEDSENVLESGSEYSEAALADGTDGAIFSHDDLTINGSGSLTVTAGYKHGIACNDDLVVTGGTISVTAVKDGIRANDSIRIMEAQIKVNAQDDGMVVAGEEGYLYIESGDLTVTAGDDGLHAGGDITIIDGSITMNAGDDGIHSDTQIDISGGTIRIQSCYEGIEAPQINISGGDITIYPTDDGLNANGGSGGFGFFGGMGQMDPFGSAQEEETAAEPAEDEEDTEDALPIIRISGGTLTIINESAMDADGIDSNGDIIISGGTILISLSNTGGNNAIDYGSENGGSCQINGGTVIACGSSSMVEEISSDSTQCSLLYRLQEEAQAGTTIRLTDSAGSVILEQEIPGSFSSAILSSPQLQLGIAYELTIGDISEEITLEEVAASAGSAVSTMAMDGMRGRGMWNPSGEVNGSEQETGSQMEERSEMPAQEEFPDMENMPEKGEMPDMENMPEMGEMSDLESMPQMNEAPRMQGNPMSQVQDQENEEDTEVSPNGVFLADLSKDTWVLLGVSVAVMLFGMIVAAKYRRN